VIVALEKLLDAWALKLCNRLLHLLCVGIFPFAVGVLGVEVIFAPGRNEGSRLLLGVEFIPVVVFEPVVILEVLRAVEPEPIGRFPLNEFIDEVCRLAAPAAWNLLQLYLDLLRKDVVPNFFAIFPDVRPLAKHAFIGYHTHREVVYSHAMVLAAHHLRSHVTGRTRCVL
jgi:hypothetical protein